MLKKTKSSAFFRICTRRALTLLTPLQARSQIEEEEKNIPQVSTPIFCRASVTLLPGPAHPIQAAVTLQAPRLVGTAVQTVMRLPREGAALMARALAGAVCLGDYFVVAVVTDEVEVIGRRLVAPEK